MLDLSTSPSIQALNLVFGQGYKTILFGECGHRTGNRDVCLVQVVVCLSLEQQPETCPPRI
jgi:hypothetical protein